MTTHPTCPALRRKPGATEAEPCDRPAGDGFICAGCTKHLERVLAELPSWLGELDTAIARQTRVTGRDGGKPTKRFEQPLPFDAKAADLLHQVRNELSTAIRGLCESRRIDTPRIERTADMALWLVAHVESIRQQPEAPDMVTWARSLRDVIRRQVDNLGTRFAGPCTARIRVLEVGSDAQSRVRIATEADEHASDSTLCATTDSDAGESRSALPVRVVERECGAPLRTRSGDRVIVCGACKARHDAAEVMARVVRDNREHMARASELADILTIAGWPVRADTVRKWGRRGKLYDWREDDLGRPMYRLGDVLDLVVMAATRSDRVEGSTA